MRRGNGVVVARATGRDRRRRALATAGILLVAALAVALQGNLPSGAAVGDAFAFDGQVSGTGTLAGDQDCQLDLDVTQEATITLAAGGEASLHLAYCLSAYDPAVQQTPVRDGTFTITTDAGTISGGATGTVASGPDPDGRFATLLQLAVTAGTGTLTGATGTLTFAGSGSLGAATLRGDLAGSVTIVELQPSSSTSATTSTSVTPVTSVPPPEPAAAVAGAPRFTG